MQMFQNSNFESSHLIVSSSYIDSLRLQFLLSDDQNIIVLGELRIANFLIHRVSLVQIRLAFESLRENLKSFKNTAKKAQLFESYVPYF